MAERVQKYTYYAKNEGGAFMPLFSLFSEREPTVDEVIGFQRQVMAQSRLIGMPRPSHVSVEELQEFDAGEEPEDAPAAPVLMTPVDRTVN